MISVLLVFSILCLSASVKAAVSRPEWTFDEKDIDELLKDWKTTNLEIKTEEVEDAKGITRKVLKILPTEGDVMLYPGGFQPFKGKDYSTLYISIRVTEGQILWQLYYITVEDPSWAESKMIQWTMQPSPEFQDFQIKIDQESWLDGTIEKIRIDPGDFRPGNLKNLAGKIVPSEIDYLSFVSAVATVDASGKLATMWGAIKYSR